MHRVEFDLRTHHNVRSTSCIQKLMACLVARSIDTKQFRLLNFRMSYNNVKEWNNAQPGTRCRMIKRRHNKHFMMAWVEAIKLVIVVVANIENEAEVAAIAEIDDEPKKKTICKKTGAPGQKKEFLSSVVS